MGATDRSGDFFNCGGGETVQPQNIDIASATGLLTEDGTALSFTVTLRPTPTVPDDIGHPFRVDVLMRDPRLPDYSVGPYRDVNRILRFEATDPPSATLLLLPERGNVTPSTFGYRDGTVSFTLAGRLLGEEQGTRPFDPSPIHWSVIGRDEDRCDRLGGPTPDLRLLRVTEAPRPGTPSAPSDHGGGIPLWAVAVVGAGAALLGVGVISVWRRKSVRT